MEKMVFTSANKLYNSIMSNESVAESVRGSKLTNDFKTLKEDLSKRDQVSMESYKEFIYDRISKIDIDESQNRVIFTIDFTKEALDRMRADIKFEKFVLDNIKSVFSNESYPGFDGRVSLYFSDKEEEFDIAVKKLEKFQADNKKSFWQIRRERQKEINEEIRKRNKERRKLEKIARNKNIVRRNNLKFISELRRVRSIELNTGRKASMNFKPEALETQSLQDLLDDLV